MLNLVAPHQARGVLLHIAHYMVPCADRLYFEVLNSWLNPSCLHTVKDKAKYIYIFFMSQIFGVNKGPLPLQVPAYSTAKHDSENFEE